MPSLTAARQLLLVYLLGHLNCHAATSRYCHSGEPPPTPNHHARSCSSVAHHSPASALITAWVEDVLSCDLDYETPLSLAISIWTFPAVAPWCSAESVQSCRMDANNWDGNTPCDDASLKVQGVWESCSYEGYSRSCWNELAHRIWPQQAPHNISWECYSWDRWHWNNIPLRSMNANQLFQWPSS